MYTESKPKLKFTTPKLKNCWVIRSAMIQNKSDNFYISQMLSNIRQFRICFRLASLISKHLHKICQYITTGFFLLKSKTEPIIGCEVRL